MNVLSYTHLWLSYIYMLTSTYLRALHVTVVEEDDLMIVEDMDDVEDASRTGRKRKLEDEASPAPKKTRRDIPATPDDDVVVLW